jgi:UDP-N-acetylglucosamine acyltransferase
MIHPTAIVETDQIGENVTIGPFTYISERVIIKDNCKILGHASIGNPAQYKETRFEDSGNLITIGEGTEIREFVTINLPTYGNTIIGKNCFLMANVHIPHDCEIGNDVIFVVGTAIGGRSKIGNYCYFGLNCSVHNKSVIGDYTVIGAASFFKGNSGSGLVWAGVPAKPLKVNTVGISRNAPSKDKDKILQFAEKNLIMYSGGDDD